MADDTTLNAGAGGDTIATDEIAAVKYQRVKITLGADGVNDGDVASGNPLPAIAVANSGVDIGDVTVNNGTGASSVPVQGAAAIDAASAGNPVFVGGRASAAAPSDVSADGDAQAVWLTLKGAVNVADGGGNLSIDDGGNSLTVDNGGTFAVQVDGAALTALQLIDNIVQTEDSAASDGQSGVPVLAVRRDTASSGVGADGDYAMLSVDSTGRLRTESEVRATSIGSYIPEPYGYPPALSLNEETNLLVDERGQLITRGTIHTDEGGFRDDFLGASLITSLTGTITFTNGSATVTGSSSLFTTEVSVNHYVRLSTDAESAWARVESVQSDTSLTLETTYSGAGGAGTGQKQWYAQATSGASSTMAVGTSALTQQVGTGATDANRIYRRFDYAPVRVTFRSAISQRIANQTLKLGLQDNPSSVGAEAVFIFDGTTNTTVICRSSSSSSANDRDEVTVQLPTAGDGTTTTAAANFYTVEWTRDQVVFLINDVEVYTTKHHLPDPYTETYVVSRLDNSAGTGSNTTIVTGVIEASTVNRLEIASSFRGAPLSIAPMDFTAQGNLTTASANTAGNAVAMSVEGLSGAVISLQGTFTATVQFEATVNGQTWVALNSQLTTTGAVVTSATGTGQWVSNVAAFSMIRARCSAYTSGTANVVLRAEQAPATMILSTGTASIGNLGTVTTVTTVSTVTAIGTSVTPGTSAAHLGKAEDAVAATGDTGVAVWGVRRDTPATNVSAAGDYSEIGVSGIGSLWATLTPNTAGGLTMARTISAATTNATSTKASAGQVYGIYCNNTNAAVRYLKLYNKASAPTVGTDVPVATLAIPPNSAIPINIEQEQGLTFATGIAWALTTGVADADTGAVAANEHVVHIWYK